MIYETTDLKLAAVLLCEIPDTRLMGLDSEKFINSKRVILIDYPEQYTNGLEKVVNDYTRKVQVVNVFQYNRALVSIRDVLRSNGVTNGNRRESKGVGNGRPY